VWVLVEVALFIYLCARGHMAFLSFVSVPDSATYDVVARNLVATGTLIPTHRTLGYPLFLSSTYLIAGDRHGPHLAIAIQLILNVVLGIGCWRLLERVVPACGTALKVFLSSVCVVAGAGMATLLLADSLATFFLFVFLYGLLFWRRWGLAVLGAGCLGLATMMRPTFTYVPVVLPAMMLLAGRFQTKVPWPYLPLFLLAAVIGAGVSTVHHYRTVGYPGPSYVVAWNLQKTLSFALADHEVSEEQYQEHFRDLVAQRHGARDSAISVYENEKLTREVFLEQLRDRPYPIVRQIVKTFLKYLFVPTETLALRLFSHRDQQDVYFRYIRPILAVVWLPIWVLAYWPPWRRRRQESVYYLFVMLLVFYVVGMSAFAPLQGERMRFPVLPFLMPVIACNLFRIHALTRVPR
jgi:hypothetical protein